MYYVAFVLLLLLAALIVRLNKSPLFNELYPSLRCGLLYLQVLSFFAAARARWPPSVNSTLSVLDVFNLDITAVLNCLVSWETKWLMVLLLPFALAVLFAVAWPVARRLVEQPGALLFRSYLSFVSFAYFSLCAEALAPFACFRDGLTGQRLMWDNPGVVCGSHYWTRLAAGGAVATAVYGALVPLGMLVALRRLRLEQPRALGTVLSAFRPDCWYWEVVLMLWRLASALVARLSLSERSLQLALTMALMGGLVLLNVRVKPFRTQLTQGEDAVAAAASLFVLTAGLFFFLLRPPRALYVTVEVATLLAVATVVGATLVATYRVAREHGSSKQRPWLEGAVNESAGAALLAVPAGDEQHEPSRS